MLSSLVSSRHYGFSHGIGRSGDLTAQQPKAIGSSLLQLLATSLTQHALQLAGLRSAAHTLLMPVATGMTLTLAMMALQREREAQGEPSQPKYVVMPRVDQKTCIKCVTAAGLQPSIVQLVVAEQSDALVTDVAAVERRIEELGGASAVLCVLSVTSCFAPRGADDVIGLAALCDRVGVAHLVNNAYGVQSRRVMEAIDRAARRGRVDAVVQSMDKNFMVPVGGAIVCEMTAGAQRKANNSRPAHSHNHSTASAPNFVPPTSSAVSSSSSFPDGAATTSSTARPRSSLVSRMSRLYPGRASSSSVADLLITLLTIGERGWLSLLTTRSSLFERLSASLHQLAERHNERVLRTVDSNDISMAVTLTLPASPSDSDAAAANSSLSLLGSMLYRRGVSGMRVWQPGAVSPFSGLPLDGWAGHGYTAGDSQSERGEYSEGARSSSRSGRSGYVSMACAVGMSEQEVDGVIEKLDETMTQWKRKLMRPTQPTSQGQAENEVDNDHNGAVIVDI